MYHTINLPRPRGARAKMVITVALDFFIKLNIYTIIKALIPNNSRSSTVDTEKETGILYKKNKNIMV